MKKKFAAIPLLASVLAACILCLSFSCTRTSPVDRMLDIVGEDHEYGDIPALCEDNFTENDLGYKLTSTDKKRLVQFVSHMSDNPWAKSPAIVREVNDCRTFGEFLFLMLDLEGFSSWNHDAGFLNPHSEKETVDSYIAFYKDFVDDKDWTKARLHRTFHKAYRDNITISEASKRRIVKELSDYETNRLKIQISEYRSAGFPTEWFSSPEEIKSEIEEEYKDCHTFRDLPCMWFLPEK